MSGVSASTIIGAGSLALGAVGTITSATAQQQQGQVARDVGNFNAASLEDRALLIESETEARVNIQRRDTARKMGQTIAAYGAAGVDIQGTPLDVAADQATEGELQAALLKFGGGVRANDMRRQAMLLRMGGNAAGEAADTMAMGTLLTGGGKLLQGAANLFPSGGTGGVIPKGVDAQGNPVRY